MPPAPNRQSHASAKERLANICEEISQLRSFRREVHETLLALLKKEDAAIDQQIDLLKLIKADTRLELGRLRKRKSRLVLGHN